MKIKKTVLITAALLAAVVIIPIVVLFTVAGVGRVLYGPSVEPEKTLPTMFPRNPPSAVLEYDGYTPMTASCFNGCGFYSRVYKFEPSATYCQEWIDTINSDPRGLSLIYQDRKGNYQKLTLEHCNQILHPPLDVVYEFHVFAPLYDIQDRSKSQTPQNMRLFTVQLNPDSKFMEYRIYHAMAYYSFEPLK